MIFSTVASFIAKISSSKTLAKRDSIPNSEEAGDLALRQRGVSENLKTQKRAKKTEILSFVVSAFRFALAVVDNDYRHLFPKSANDFPSYLNQSKRTKFPSTTWFHTGTKASYTSTDRFQMLA